MTDGYAQVEGTRWRDWLKAEAARLGFDRCGVAAVQRPVPTANRFLAWAADGRAGEMEYLVRNADRRCDPGLVVEGAASWIVVARNIYLGDPAPDAAAVVARYAWVRDYHRWMEKALKSLATGLRAEVGGEAKLRYYVDTGPVLERDAAARAGLGWIGKHTNLIAPDLGNWLMLGVILTDLGLPADPPMRDHCGRCRRCIDACPTGAITAPYRVDARRCISYLTIELRGWIPTEFRVAIGNRLFGCDICLEVCPWNRFAKVAALEGIERREAWRRPKPLEWLELGEAEFRSLFQGHPILRVKREGLLRNCCVVLGNSGDPAAVSGLARRLLDEHESPVVRGHAAWALGRIGGAAARAVLADAHSRLSAGFQDDPDPDRARLKAEVCAAASGSV